MDGSRAGGVILQHGEDGPPALFADWCCRRGIPFETRRVWEGKLPSGTDSFGWICSLGSDETPGAPGRPKWVDAEVAFLRTAMDAGVPVLGLCFGGQALATAAGGTVLPSDPAEVGWMKVESSAPADIPVGPWLHFHYAQLHPPVGAAVLARSLAGTAAFRLGRHLGLQFHPEATPEIANEWARVEATELRELGITPEGVAEQGRIARGEAEAAAGRLFDSWWKSLQD